MSGLISGDILELDPAPRSERTASAPAAVQTLFTTSSSNPLGLDDWLREILRAVGGRLAALVALLENEPVVHYIFPKQTELPGSVNWPGEGTGSGFPVPSPATATLSADGRSSFLTVAVQHGGMLWVLSVEDGGQRTWSLDDQAALTLAALGIFQFAPENENSQRWAKWSQQLELQRRLEQAATVVGRLVHDFNNVFTGVLGFTELSLAQLPADSAHRNFIGEVYAAAQQGSQLLNQLGLFGMRKTPTQGPMTSLRSLWAQEEQRWRQAWGDAVTLQVQVPADLPALAIDADSLKIVLEKLVENAREAVGSGGTVAVSAQQVELTREDCLGLLGQARPGSYVEIAVADSGRGLSPEARRRVFAEPLFSTKPRHRGLGLASVYGILNSFGGGIRLDDGRESGTLARVYVPTAGHAPAVRSRELLAR